MLVKAFNVLLQCFPILEKIILIYDETNKGHTRDAGPGFSYSCRKHFLITNNETRVSEFF